MKPRLYDVVKQAIDDVNIVKMADSIENQFESKLKEKLTQADVSTATCIGVKIKIVNFMDSSFEMEDVKLYKEYSQIPERAKLSSTEIYTPLERLIKSFNERHYMCYVTDYGERQRIFIGFTMCDENTIEGMNFDRRTYMLLKWAGFYTCQDIVSRITTYDDISTIRNMGKKRAKEVIEKVRDMGFTSFCEDFEN